MSALSLPARRLAAAATGLALSFGLLAATAEPAGAIVPTPPAPACTTALVPGLPLLRPLVGGTPQDAWNELTATDNHGLWAGVRYDGGNRFQVIAWRAGRTQVLDTFTYGNFGPQGTVQVIGITSAHAIIVNAALGDGGAGATTIYRYQAGHRFEYARNGTWKVPVATGVAPDGHVVGLVRTTSNNYLIAEWDPSGRATTIVAGNVSDPTIDSYDDVIWDQYPPNGTGQLRFRTPAGKLGQLLPYPNPDAGSVVAAGRWVWSEPGEIGHSAVQTWDMAAVVKGNLSPPARPRVQSFFKPVAGSPAGAFVFSDVNRRRYALYDAYGDGHQLNAGGNRIAPYFGVANDGTLALLGSDGRVRFVNCPLNYAKHNPRGLMYHGAVINGQTLLTGGAFDADSRAAHLLVGIYDETSPTRTLVARTIADQADPSFSGAFGVGGNHRFRVVLPAKPGRHVYCAYGVNIGYGNSNARLGCTTVTA